MAIKGSLREASLADVCQLLSMGQKTGCLSVTDQSRFGQVFFDKGRITFARVVNRRDRIGDLLVADGVISSEQLKEVIAEQGRRPDKRLGELLLENGFITAEHLAAVIRVQIEEAVYHLFTWSQGSFFFEVDQAPDETDYLVSINPESLLLEGARRVDEWSVIEKKIPSLDLIFDLDRERLRASDVELTPEQEKVAPLLDGTRSVQDVADRIGLVEFDVGKALYGLLQAGFAHRVGRRAPAEAGRLSESEADERRNLGIAFYRSGMLEDAVREFRRVLELRPEDASALNHLALLALRQGRAREALQRLKQMVEERGPSHASFVNLAYAMRELGRREDALLALDEAERLRSDSAPAALLRCLIHLEEERYGEAEAALAGYRACLGGRAAAPQSFHLAALLAGAGGDLVAATAAAAEGLEDHPDSVPLLLTAGVIAERAGRFEDAEALYRHAAEEGPSVPQVHKNLGDLAYRRGQYDEALESYRRAVELAPELGDDIYARLGNLHYKRFEREQALEYWKRSLELNPSNQVVRNNLEVVANAV
ncbi:MAG TPA: DUF4388 domain-containing protein [Longimicrobiales bacterium]|nr:DUF4388 domain-containing protein [Longimicrobiales bacterium]